MRSLLLYVYSFGLALGYSVPPEPTPDVPPPTTVVESHAEPPTTDDGAGPTIDQVMQSINSAIRQKALGNNKYSDYSVKTVSWDDVSRFKDEDSGELSVWGDNICDTRLYAKDGRQLYTVRSDNWNEKIGVVETRDIRLVEGNQAERTLNEITLRDFLADSVEFGGYVGLKTDSLLNKTLDKKVSMRFQTTFLPVDDAEKATFQFNSQMYNYASFSDDDPRNLILLATPMGIALQQDGAGTKDIFHHEIKDGNVMQYWLEAERTEEKVGGAQKEDAKATLDALSRGKSRARNIGIRPMGTRFNVVMAIQIPLEQDKPRDDVYGGDLGMPMMESMNLYLAEPMMDDMSMQYDGMDIVPAPSLPGPPSKIGTSNAARVSTGDEAGIYYGLKKDKPKRHTTEHITVTVSFYYTVAGGVPSEKDVMAAIDDIENMYESIENGRLGDEKFEDTFTKKIKNPKLVALLRKYKFTRSWVAKESKMLKAICKEMNEGEKNAFLNSFPE